MKTETKVVMVLAAALVLGEVMVRRVEGRLSKDVAHLREMGRLDEVLAPRGEAKVLLVGNSLIRCAVNPGLLTVPGQAAGGVAALHPDASGVVEWRQAFRRHVLQRGAKPAWVILGTGQGHLADPAELNVERLGAWLVPPRERLAFWREEGLGLERGVPFLLAGMSKLYANRGRVQPLLFYNAVPGYEGTARLLNEEHGRKLVASLGDARSDVARSTARHLEGLLQDVKETGARVVVVALPTPQRYTIPEPIRQTLEAHGAALLDFASVHALASARFPDGYHLDAEGAREFTQLLNAELARRWAQ